MPIVEINENGGMKTRVKICGITSVADGLAAAEAGADLIGLMLYETSPRRVTLPQASEIAHALPPFVLRVGVFVNPSPDFVLQARLLYDRIETAAATQRITVARPTLTTAYAVMKYDYMSGYLWMFVMGTIGIIITIAFTRVEARGLVRKRGVEEALES